MAFLSGGVTDERFSGEILCNRFQWTLKKSSTLGSCNRYVKSPSFPLIQSNKCCFKMACLGFLFNKDNTAYAKIYIPRNINFSILKTTVSIVNKYDHMKLTRSTVSTRPLLVDLEMSDYASIEFELLPSRDINEENGWLDKDTMSMLCEITMIQGENKSSLKLKDHLFSSQTAIPTRINVYRENSKFFDVRFCIGKTKLPAHKVILAAYSPVFEAMFTTNMSEHVNNTVKIEDVDANVFKAFLTCVYTGRIAKMDKFIDKLLILSDKYQIDSMKNMCEEYINDHLDLNNAIDYLLLAYHHGSNSLKRIVLPFVHHHRRKLAVSANFAKLCEYPDLVAEMFRTIAD